MQENRAGSIFITILAGFSCLCVLCGRLDQANSAPIDTFPCGIDHCQTPWHYCDSGTCRSCNIDVCHIQPLIRQCRDACERLIPNAASASEQGNWFWLLLLIPVGVIAVGTIVIYRYTKKRTENEKASTPVTDDDHSAPLVCTEIAKPVPVLQKFQRR
ncbi:hypothetical protein ScPMuIL_004400 [Solemya velum]